VFAASLILAVAAAGMANPERVGQNGARFRQALHGDDRVRHALDRLTFGARPGEVAAVKAEGLQRWLNDQLHPEATPENPELERRLRPLETLRLTPEEAHEQYPSPQMVLAVLRGKRPMPDDPQERRIIEKLGQHYSKRGGTGVLAADADDDSDLELTARLSDVLSAAEMETLRSGNPEQKRAVLAGLSPSKYEAFAWALRREQRRALEPLAPPALRRQLMFAVNPESVIASDLSDGKILRAVYSTHQLQELLVDFWFNHFNVFLDKGADRYLVSSYERDAIRPHVFGKFYDLLLATAESPAMLFYLDNWQSVGADSPRAQNANKQRGLNENYGRELMELHTLGVDGGYTQQDVIEVARCFTGWTIANPNKSARFEYNDRMHDKGRKVVLGHAIPAGGGMNDGLEVLNLLAHQPATAHFVSLELAKRFVADDPPPELVDRMAKTFLSKDGDLREVMRTMMQSPEFWSAGAYQAKVKTPFEMVVSAVRASNADLQSVFPLGNEIQKLGEPLYRKIEPTGYSNANAEWVSSASLLERMNFAIALAHNKVPGVRVDTSLWSTGDLERQPMEISRVLLQADPSAATKQAIEKAIGNPDLQKQLTAEAKAGPPQLPSLVAGLTLGSPDFQKH
jgi:uncharacterized protein (DUF1800 family)